MGVDSGPHSFRPYRWWDAFRKNGRCRGCYAPRHAHPIHFWIRARPIGDGTKAELSFDVLSGSKP